MAGVVSLLKVDDDTRPKSSVQPDRAPTWSHVGRDYHPGPGDPEQPTKFDLVININTAKPLGLAVPGQWSSVPMP
jgi:hypothetical protein